MQKTLNDFFPNLPRLTQISNTHCGPAVIAMLLANIEVKTSQNEIVEKSNLTVKKLNKYGSTVWELAEAAKKTSSDINFWTKDNANISDLESVLNLEYPVGVEWQGEFLQYSDDENGHYSVITNIEKNNNFLYIADPYEPFSGRDRKLNINRFEELWWDINIVRDKLTGKMVEVKDIHMMFAITTKNFTFPEEIGMKII